MNGRVDVWKNRWRGSQIYPGPWIWECVRCETAHDYQTWAEAFADGFAHACEPLHRNPIKLRWS